MGISIAFRSTKNAVSLRWFQTLRRPGGGSGVGRNGGFEGPAAVSAGMAAAVAVSNDR
jgi:hypothetical protein